MKMLDEDFPKIEAKLNVVTIEKIDLVNHFATLAAIDVSAQVEKKNNLSYLSWAWAVDRLLRADPGANWTYNEPVSYGQTLMVSCTVTAFDKPMTMQLPVMDYRNKAIANPDAFAVNTAMQRCLVKAIALHGLGLYIYAGEDLPYEDKPEQKKPKTVAGEEWDKLDQKTKDWMLNEAMAVAVMIGDGDIVGAYQHLEALNMDGEHKTAFWSRLDSKQKRSIKACGDLMKANSDGELINAWGLVPQYAKNALTALHEQRKAELGEA